MESLDQKFKLFIKKMSMKNINNAAATSDKKLVTTIPDISNYNLRAFIGTPLKVRH